MPPSLSLAAVALLALAPFARAVPNQQQIDANLGTTPDLKWIVSGPSTPTWSVPQNGILKAPLSAPGTTYLAEATVTGPGVLGLRVMGHSMHDVSIYVDGVLSGAENGAADLQRVSVGPGNHVVRWKIVRNARPEDYPGYSLSLMNASWEPFTGLALATGTKGTGITLSQLSGPAWIGQDRWHRGDGAAAWSGVITSLGESSGLRATVEGPGVLSYSFLTRGTGKSDSIFDGQRPLYVYSEEGWGRVRRFIPAGTHTLDWINSLRPDHSGRGSYEMTLDEIELLPLVPLDVALETSGRKWTASTLYTWDSLPCGVGDDNASGGSLVAGSNNGSISSPIDAPCLVKIRHRGSISVDSSIPYTPPFGSYTQLPGGWYESVFSMPEWAETLTVKMSEDVEIDRIEILQQPGSLAMALGVPEEAISTGGPNPWTVSPFPAIGSHGVGVVMPWGSADSWLDLAVTGPAEISFDRQTWQSHQRFSVLVDGREINGMIRSEQHASNCLIEIPAGNHTLRWLARPDTSFYDNPPPLLLGNLRITPLPPGGRLLEALDFDAPIATSVPWTSSSAYPREGQSTLQGPLISSGSFSISYPLQASFSGPGKVSFWWFSENDPDGGNADWSFTGDRIFGSGRTNHSRGWRKETVYLPPGSSSFSWGVTGTSGQIARTALDGIAFTPAPVFSLAEALDEEDIDWRDDPERPWSAFIQEEMFPGDVVLSPALAKGESARISATINGPGQLGFKWLKWGDQNVEGTFLVNGQAVDQSTAHLFNDRSEIRIEEAGPVTVEWVASNTSYVEYFTSWVGMDQVVWTPDQSVPLALSLDAPPSVAWQTSGDVPFEGRSDPDAYRDSSGRALVSQGSEAWLEATVNGPGSFDFWLRPSEGIDISSSLWDFWSLTIDGVPAEISGTSWNEQWITGGGPHKIRLTLRNPQGSGYELIAGAVDQVSWNPAPALPLTQAAGLANQKWKTDSRLPTWGLGSGGRDGVPTLLMRALRNRTSWAQSVVKGPCLLSWDSHLRLNEQAGDSQVSLLVNGKRVLRLSEHEWQRMRLTLPAGSHTLRWIAEPWDAEEPPPAAGEPEAFDAIWRLSGMTLAKGMSPLAEALDAPGLFALEIGDEGGSLVMTGGQDAWEPGLQVPLYFFSPAKTGSLSIRWGRPDSSSGGLLHRDHEGSEEVLSNSGAGWTEAIAILAPDAHSRWSYDPESGATVPYLDSALLPDSKTRTLAQAIESKAAVSSYSWLGFDSPQAKVGKDLAWSLLKYSNQENLAFTTLKGPARISFWWKKTGEGSLALSVDGSALPLPLATGEWSQVEFDINAGAHLVGWSHAIANFESQPQAWIDGLKSHKIPATTLAQAAAPQGGIELSSNSQITGQIPWHPVALLESNGGWTKAARAASGGKTLTTSVTGPALLKLSARCFDDFAASDGAFAKRLVESIAGDRITRMSQHLSISVDGREQARIDASTAGAWQFLSVHIPNGSHEVSFHLTEVNRSFFGDWIANSTNTELQGWVTGLQVKDPQDHHAAWEAAHGLPAGSGDLDSDGDGSSNGMEYRFGTDPLSAASIPPSLQILPNPWIRNDPRLLLRVPFLPAHSSAVLEMSDDLRHWDLSPYPLNSYPRGSSWIFAPLDTPTHQGIELPAEERRYYRLRFEE